jgi:hypothetical protein
VRGGRFAKGFVALSVVLFLGLAATSAGASTATYPPFSKSVPLVPVACITRTSIPPDPVAQIHNIEQSVGELVGTYFQSIGQGGNGLLVLMLTAGSEPVAQRVRAKFGPSVQIMVGLTNGAAIQAGVRGAAHCLRRHPPRMATRALSNSERSGSPPVPTYPGRWSFAPLVTGASDWLPTRGSRWLSRLRVPDESSASSLAE